MRLDQRSLIRGSLIRLCFLYVIFCFGLPVFAMGDIEKIEPITAVLEQRFPEKTDKPILLVDVSKQELVVWENGNRVKTYPISTASKGTGNIAGSYKTPLGIHYIRSKIGKDLPAGTILKARANTGVIAQIEHDPVVTGVDHVTSRILWLSGLEQGINQGGNVDSYSRYIYIHGTHEEGLLGQPASKGCIRMSNTDIISLFDHVPGDSLVYISVDLTKEQ